MGLQGGGWSAVARGLVAKPCTSCRASAATVFCRADSAFLCLACDTKIHAANKLATRHERVWMCEVCEQAPASVTCKADAAALCVTCDADIHSANPLARRHDRVPIEPFFDPAETVIAKTTTASVAAAAPNFLVPNVDVLSNTELANANDDDASTWLIPNPNFESKLLMDAPEIIKSSAADVFFPEMNSLLEFDYPNPIHHSISGSGTDSVVPVQPGPVQQHSVTINHASGDRNCFDLDFCRSKLSSSFSYPTQSSLSQSVSSSSLDVGVVPDGNSMSDISYPFGRNVSHSVSDPSVQVSSTTGSLPATQLCGLDREARVMRYREKRKNRKFQKTIRYASRKAYAETRPRIKGRFAKRTKTETEVADHIYGSAMGSFIAEHQYGVVPTFCQ